AATAHASRAHAALLASLLRRAARRRLTIRRRLTAWAAGSSAAEHARAARAALSAHRHHLRHLLRQAAQRRVLTDENGERLLGLIVFDRDLIVGRVNSRHGAEQRAERT